MVYYIDAIIAAFLSALTTIVLKFICFDNYVSVIKCFNTILLFFAIIYIVINLFGAKYGNKYFELVPFSLDLKKQENRTMLFIALFLILSLVFVYFCYRSVSSVSNPGYFQAILNTNIIIVFLLSLYLFNVKFNFYAGLGILLSFIGIYLIIKNSK